MWQKKTEADNFLFRMMENSKTKMACFSFPDLKCQYANNAFCKITGLKLEQIYSVTLADILEEESLRAPEKEQEKLKKDIENLFNKKFHLPEKKLSLKTEFIKESSKSGTLSGFILTIRKKTGDQSDKQSTPKLLSEQQEKDMQRRTQELEGKSKTLKDSQTALVYLLEDVNEAREELEVLNEKLLVANAELESFSYSVSHDLKAPLRAISGFSSLLLNNHAEQLDEEGKRMLHIVIKSTHAMNELINDLLSFSRISRQEIRLTPVNIQELAQRIFREALINSNNPNAELVFREPLPVTMGDIPMIKQLLINLISNALKFTSMREKACIEIGAKEKNRHIEYYVKDNGIGFNMKYVHKLFNVFQRLHNNDEFPGTGIGLAIVKRIALKHGGNVRAESQPGKGATFYFELKKP
jgi:signal transduction histidine kinase